MNLAAWNIPLDRITATGIPVHPLFARSKNEWECKGRHGLSEHRPVVLQLAGGLGVGPIGHIHRQTLETELPLQLVVVTGRNAAAREELQAVPCPARHRRIILGYTDKMDELMAAADAPSPAALQLPRPCAGERR
jgi:processive 1,2-diacylglycerol beta-glucosyltransferase